MEWRGSVEEFGQSMEIRIGNILTIICSVFVFVFLQNLCLYLLIFFGNLINGCLRVATCWKVFVPPFRGKTVDHRLRSGSVLLAPTCEGFQRVLLGLERWNDASWIKSELTQELLKHLVHPG